MRPAGQCGITKGLLGTDPSNHKGWLSWGQFVRCLRTGKMKVHSSQGANGQTYSQQPPRAHPGQRPQRRYFKGPKKGSAIWLVGEPVHPPLFGQPVPGRFLVTSFLPLLPPFSHLRLELYGKTSALPANPLSGQLVSTPFCRTPMHSQRIHG